LRVPVRQSCGMKAPDGGGPSVSTAVFLMILAAGVLTLLLVALIDAGPHH
jgi:hypothetical protein